jgi:hypothetical protein
MCQVSVEYEDGRLELAGNQFATLEQACADALRLADYLGGATGDGHGPPRWVCVYCLHELKIRISILRGGLLGQIDARGSQATS